jgi:hypothetical protein
MFGSRRKVFVGIASCLFLLGGTVVSDSHPLFGGAASAAGVVEGPFTIVADDYSFQGVPTKIRAVTGCKGLDCLTPVTVRNVSPDEAHEFLIVRVKDNRRNWNFARNSAAAKRRLVQFFNFEAQEDPNNVGGFTPGFASKTSGGTRDASMGNVADVFRDSFGGEDTHEVPAVAPGTNVTNGLDLTRPGRYLYFCPITALAKNDPHQEPHYTHGQMGYLEVVAAP